MDANGDAILNSYNWDCGWYDGSDCGWYDTDMFVANDMCCICGGGAVPNEEDGDETDDDGQDLENIQIDAD